MRAGNHNNLKRPCGSRRGGGFTLVEILIVVVILGILATLVIPQFTSASHQARENTLKDDLRYLRLQFQLFKAQHRDIPPGYPAGNITATPTESDLLAQMTQYSAEDCTTNASASSTHRFGPYLSRFPTNPITDYTTVYVVPNGTPMPLPAALPVMNGGTPYGWIYKPQTQEIMANIAGDDSNGTPFAKY